jgi:heme oxygenase
MGQKMNASMDIKNIRMGIATVCIIVAQAVTVVWMVASAVGEIKRTATDVATIKDDFKKDAADRALWQQKMEAEMSDLKVRTAISEAKIKELEIKLFGR